MLNNRSLQALRTGVLVCALVGALQYACANTHEPIVVRYLPFDIETYSAITKDNIAQSTSCVYSGVPEELQKAMRDLVIESDPGNFNPTRVRVKIEGLLDGDAYFDAEGGIYVEADKSYRKLTSSEFKRFRNIFSAIERRDCLFGIRTWPAEMEDRESDQESEN